MAQNYTIDWLVADKRGRSELAWVS